MDRPISDRELAALVQTELEQSGSWVGSEWREAVKQSLNYLLLRKKGDEVEGRSQIQSGDVADMLDHVQAEIQPMYAVDALWEVLPEGPNDDDAAHSESAAMNWYWRERLRGYEVLDEAVQDGLLSRNGYIKIYFEESWGLPYKQELEGDRLQIDAQIAQLGQDGSRVEVLEGEIIQAAQTVIVEGIGPDGMTPITAEQELSPEIVRVELKVTPFHQECKAECVAPEDLFVSRDATGSNLQRPRFVAQRRRMARMDVRALGFAADQVDRMPQHSTWDSDVRTARKTDYNTYSRQAAHHSGQTVDLYECYYRVDRDGDGIPELIKVFYGFTGELLSMEGEDDPYVEMVRVRPFASGSPMKVAHRHEGRSLFDKEKQIEDTKRALLRQLLDNLYEANDTTTVVGRNVSPDDMEQTDVGRVIYADNPPTDVVAFKHNNIAGESLTGLTYMDKIRRERGGSSIDMSAESVPVNQAAHSTERIMSAMEKLIGMYARNFANTLIRDVGILLHEQLKLMPGRIAFEDGQEWAETEPRYWVERNRLVVKMGKTEGEKAREAQALVNVMDIQRQDGEGGFGILVNYEQMYEARIDYARCAGLSDPAQYWMDPQSDEALAQIEQDQQEEQQAQQLAMAQQEQLMRVQLQAVQMQEMTRRMSDQMDAMEAQRDRFAKLLIEMSKLEIESGKDLPFGVVEGGKEALPSL